jgi:hypothetical protein
MDSLPTELMQDIASYLPSESQAALALSNKKTLYMLGSATLKLSGQAKHRLLLLLAKDGLYPDDIPCPFCLRFHSSPEISNPWGSQTCEGRRLTAPRDCQVCFCSVAPTRALYNMPRAQKAISTFLGPRVHFNTVAALMRSHRLGRKKEMPPTREIMPTRTGNILRCEDFRIVNGHLLLKTEMLLLPHSTNQLSDDVRHMVDSIYEDAWTAHACGHSTWLDLYPEVLGLAHPSQLEIVKHKTCLWTHENSCSECGIPAERQALFGCGRNSLFTKFCGGDTTGPEDDSLSITKVLAGVGVVLSCEDCHTDVSLCFVDDLGPGRRVCVLTSWKDLGTGEELGEGFDSREWHSHLWTVASHLRNLGRKRETVFEAYEKDTGQYRDGPPTWQAAPSMSILESLKDTRQYRDGPPTWQAVPSMSTLESQVEELDQVQTRIRRVRLG